MKLGVDQTTFFGKMSSLLNFISKEFFSNLIHDADLLERWISIKFYTSDICTCFNIKILHKYNLFSSILMIKNLLMHQSLLLPMKNRLTFYFILIFLFTAWHKTDLLLLSFMQLNRRIKSWTKKIFLFTLKLTKCFVQSKNFKSIV